MKLFNQAVVGGRIRQLIRSRYGGEYRSLAKDAEVDASILRDIDRSKVIGDQAFMMVVNRIIKHTHVSGQWLRTGQGDMIQLPHSVRTVNASASKESQVMPGTANGNGHDISLFVGLARRVEAIEEALELIQTNHQNLSKDAKEKLALISGQVELLRKDDGKHQGEIAALWKGFDGLKAQSKDVANIEAIKTLNENVSQCLKTIESLSKRIAAVEDMVTSPAPMVPTEPVSTLNDSDQCSWTTYCRTIGERADHLERNRALTRALSLTAMAVDVYMPKQDKKQVNAYPVWLLRLVRDFWATEKPGEYPNDDSNDGLVYRMITYVRENMKQ